MVEYVPEYGEKEREGKIWQVLGGHFYQSNRKKCRAADKRPKWKKTHCSQKTAIDRQVPRGKKTRFKNLNRKNNKKRRLVYAR